MIIEALSLILESNGERLIIFREVGSTVDFIKVAREGAHIFGFGGVLVVY